MHETIDDFFETVRNQGIGLAELEEAAIAYIRENGPVSSDTLPIDGEIFWHSSMHWSGNWHKKSQAARSVLEQLYTDGTLVIHHKNSSRKYYDLAEKYLPKEYLETPNPCKTEEEFQAWRVLRRIGAVGLLWDKNSTALLGVHVNAQECRRVLVPKQPRGTDPSKDPPAQQRFIVFIRGIG